MANQNELDLNHVDTAAKPSGTGCAECLANGGWWFHLRRCAACGHIGCCDSSPSQHATAHFRQTGHRYITSFEPGENWWWDYTTDQAVRGVTLPPPDARPVDQEPPAPRDRVPETWQDELHS
ncbi:UBP-type zinc finger domain-containing protein [Aestuariimicrobium kwangyangense]|uniref:UBP-type zinc finger domain-containing protein n=1 Tax=Aestuariimicrobium kwangyangense TaxID=396389 RepID=UPI0003B62616|nr:UBP-type zinc finger domain-containing protein [Aestuariimicrobium kwangyangense]